MSFFSFQKKSTLSFVFDIRDSSVSLAAVRFDMNKKPEIIACQNFEITVGDIKDYEKYLASMLATLDMAILETRKSLVKIGNREKIGTYHFFIGSPWSISKSKLIKIVKDRAFEINNQVLEKIFAGEESASAKELENISSQKDWKVYEEKILESRISGYKIENIFGKKTTDLAVELLVSFMPSEFENRIRLFSDQKLGKRALRHSHSSIISSYSYLRDLVPAKNTFVYVDIGAFITDVYVVRDGIIYGIISYPYGEKDIVKSTALKTKTRDGMLLSTINISRDGNHDTDMKEFLDKSVNGSIQFWFGKLTEAISKICTEINMPEDIFMIPNSGLSDFLAHKMSSKEKGNILKILGTEIKVDAIPEEAMNASLTNGKMFVNQPYIKMDITFLNKMLAEK